MKLVKGHFQRRLWWAFGIVASSSAVLGGIFAILALFWLGIFDPRKISPPARGTEDTLGGRLLSLAIRIFSNKQISQFPLLAGLMVCILLGLILLLVLGVTRRVLTQVQAVAQAAQRLAAGELNIRLPVTGNDDFADLLSSFNQMAQALNGQVQELEFLGIRARQFSADVSHELRTPVATMVAVADVFDQDLNSADAVQAAKLISQEIRHLAALVEDILEISRFDSGTAQLRLVETDLAQLIPATLRRRGWAELVQVSVMPGTLLWLDPRRIDIIVANFVANAIRYGEPPIELMVQLNQQHQIGGLELSLTVRDYGAGLDPAQAERVFDRFVKLANSRNRATGSGLGLAITRENASLHGGKVFASNHPDGGAIFWLQLPVTRAQHKIS